MIHDRSRLHVFALLRLAVGVTLGAAAGCDGDKGEAPATDEERASAETPNEKAKGAKEKKEPKKTAKKSTDEKAVEAKPEAEASSAKADLIEYVPDGAKLVIVADPAALASSALLAGPSEYIEKARKSRLGDIYGAASKCKVPIDTWSSIVLAADSDADDRMIFAARGTGIGKKATVQCLADRINETNTTGRWTVSEDKGRVVFDVEGEKTRGISADDDVLLAVGKAYEKEVIAILDGAGKSAAGGSLKPLLAGVDRKKPVYFAGLTPREMREGPLEDLKHLAGTIDFSTGVAVAVTLEYGDASKASTNAETLQELFGGLKTQVASLGVPTTILETVKIDAKGTTVATSASASKADIEALAAALEKAF